MGGPPAGCLREGLGQGLVGGNDPRSGKPAVYDSKACVSELAHNAKVRNTLASGWSPVEPGCISETTVAWQHVHPSEVVGLPDSTLDSCGLLGSDFRVWAFRVVWLS